MKHKPILQDLMNDNERTAFISFQNKHRGCCFPSAIGGKFSVEVTGTGLGYCFVCKCNACGCEESITDINCW